MKEHLGHILDCTMYYKMYKFCISQQKSINFYEGADSKYFRPMDHMVSVLTALICHCSWVLL